MDLLNAQVTTIGFLLAGVGETLTNQRWKANYLVVSDGRFLLLFWVFKNSFEYIVFVETCIQDVEQYFTMLVRHPLIGIILVGADLWNYIYPLYQKLNKATLPMLLKIPTKSSKTRPIRLKACETTANEGAPNPESHSSWILCCMSIISRSMCAYSIHWNHSLCFSRCNK